VRARYFSSFVLVGSALLAPRPARAQSSAAEALFDQGRTALAAGDFETACARFRASDQVEPAAGTRANLADCEEKRGKVATAWEVYKSALAKLPPADARATVIRERIAKLEARLPKLVLTLAPGAPKETSVREGEATIGTAATYGLALPLDPGVHHLVASAPDRPATNVDVTLVEGSTSTVVVDLGTVAAQAPAALPPIGTAVPLPADRQDASEKPFFVRHRASAALGGAAVVLAAAGVGVGVAAWQGYDHLASTCQRPCTSTGGVVAEARATDVLFAVAGAAALTSLGLFVLLERDRGSVSVGPTQGGARALVRF
jgi:hypothetical protein